MSWTGKKKLDSFYCYFRFEVTFLVKENEVPQMSNWRCNSGDIKVFHIPWIAEYMNDVSSLEFVDITSAPICPWFSRYISIWNLTTLKYLFIHRGSWECCVYSSTFYETFDIRKEVLRENGTQPNETQHSFCSEKLIISNKIWFTWSEVSAPSEFWSAANNKPNNWIIVNS